MSITPGQPLPAEATHPQFGTGRVPDPPDDRDWPVRAFVAPKITPKAIDYRKRLGPVLNQGNTPQCVTHTAAVIKAFQERKESRRTYQFDPAAAYAQCKTADRTAGRWAGDGTFARTICDVMKDQGYGRRGKDWATDAYPFRIDGYARVSGIAEMEQALAQFGPIFLGISWYSEWFTPERMPTPMLLSTPTRTPRNAGGHEITIAGYDRSGKRFAQPVALIRNSWGAEWGEDGCAWITYEELERQLALPPAFAADLWSTVDYVAKRQIIVPATVTIAPPSPAPVAPSPGPSPSA